MIFSFIVLVKYIQMSYAGWGRKSSFVFSKTYHEICRKISAYLEKFKKIFFFEKSVQKYLK